LRPDEGDKLLLGRKTGAFFWRFGQWSYQGRGCCPVFMRA
jgi:hypothetical protein